MKGSQDCLNTDVVNFHKTNGGLSLHYGREPTLNTYNNRFNKLGMVMFIFQALYHFIF